VLERRLDLAERIGHMPLVEVVARLGVEVDRVEDRAPHVVLLLVVGAVADAHRPRALVAREVVETCSSRSRSPPTPYMTCRSSSRSATSATKQKKSLASQSKPSVYSAQSANVESRIQV
jgi:hypothetical protein